MKRKTLLIMLLVALFVPLALNAQTRLNNSLRSSKTVQKRIAGVIPSNDKGNSAAQMEIARVVPSNNRGDRASSTVNASKITSSSVTWTGSAGETWSVAITGGATNQNMIGEYAQFGTRNNPSTSGTFSTSGITGTITSVAVDCASYNGLGNVSVTVGGAAFGGSQSIPSWSNNAGGTRTFSGSASGAIVVTMTNGTSNQRRAMYIKSITVTYSACGAPENLTVSNTTPTSATVTWEGSASSYNLQYRQLAEETVYFSDNFESGSLDTKGWTTIRNGQGTEYTDWRVINGQTTFSSGAIDGHSGIYFAMTRSWSSSAYGVDNWLITPQVTLDGTLKFWVQDDGQYHETFYVYVSTGTNAIADFSLLSSPGNATDVWSEVTVDLSSYNGAQGYIAIRHQDYNQDYLFMDDFSISKTTGTDGAWSSIIPVNGNSYTIEGLSDDKNYEVQVQGVCDGNQSNWVSTTFSTLSLCAAPTNLTAQLTDNSVELSWTGYMDSYTVQYRIPAFDGYYINEPLTPDNIGDWGTYLIDDNSGFYYTDDTQTDVCWVFSYNTNPPQYLFSPDFPRPTLQSETLTFDYKVANASYPETFEVLYFVGDDIVEEDAVTVSNTDWEQYTSQVPVGATSFVIAYLSNDQLRLYLDNFVIASDEPVTEGTDWMSATSNGNSLSLGFNGLESESIYEWQVQGEGCDDWSASSYFTTPEIPDVLVESISADDINVVVGATATITATVLPAEANPAVTYTSNDETVATVNENGVVTGVAAGSTTITIAATDGSGVTTTINVTVSNIDVTGITATPTEITMITGETATISYTVAPNNATDPSVTFTSANTAVATVDASGVVTGVAPGNTTITIASVSNPEITATVNVTVNSNPNAVQFTVNAPANARPGQTITVDFVLAAPTVGTYTGFTGLDVNLYFDNTAFQYNSKANGAVANAVLDIDMGQVTISGPNTNFPNRVKALLVTPANYPVTTGGIVFSATFTVLDDVTLGSYTFNAVINEFDYTTGAVGNSTTVDIPYEFTPSTVEVTGLESYTKHIIGYDDDSDEHSNGDNWYLIATPIGEVAPSNVTNLINDDGYDLYYFDQTQRLEWITYKEGEGATDPGFNLVPGKGYLYANKETVDLVFTGTGIVYSETNPITVTLSYDETQNSDEIMHGFNLVGNPFATQDAYINKPFYKMNEAGNAILGTEASGAIAPMEGVFVKVSTEETLTFSISSNGKSSYLAMNLSKGASRGSCGIMDRAIVTFDESEALPKFQFRDGSTKVFIPMEGKDYAVVSAQGQGEMPVSFKAEENGRYTLSFNAEEVEFNYLHLIDNKTGNDVDLLANPSYSFDARTTDYASRFKLVFVTGSSTSSDTFAFFSNGGFVINNEGNATLQVININGRILKSESINGCANVNVNAAAGVYMLRLVNGDNVKTLKVVVE